MSPLSPSSALSAEPRMIGVSSPGNSYLVSSSRTSISTSSSSSGSSTMSTLFRKTTMYGTPTWRASRMCSRVCGIGPSARRHHQDRAVHLRRAGDHVLDVVGVARAVDVRVVALLRLVLHVRRGDRDAALALFRRLVDLVVRHELRAALRRQHLGDRRRQRRLAVVDVTDRADVHVRLVALELLLGHLGSLSSCDRLRPRREIALLPSVWSARSCDDFLGDFGRVVAELHGVGRRPWVLRAQVGRVAEHRRQRHLAAMTWRCPRSVPSPGSSRGGVQVADDVAHVVLGRDDLDVHDRLEQDRPPSAAPSWKAIEPAILNAISDESTSW